jgi:anthranilate phosphoribosyltransferase
VTLAGVTNVTEVMRSGEREFQYRPEDFGLPAGSLDSIRVSGPAESAALIRRVLAGEPGDARDIVILNASAGLLTFDGSLSPTAAAQRASKSIDSGAAVTLLRRLAELSHANSPPS